MLLRKAAAAGSRLLLDSARVASSSQCHLGQPSTSHTAQHLSAVIAAAARHAPVASMESAPLAPPGYSRTFYKRQLPSPPAIAFASDRGALLSLK